MNAVEPNDDYVVRKADDDTVRVIVMVAPELLSDTWTSSEWARVDVELPRRHSTAHDLRQSLVVMAPLRPDLPFRLYGGRNPHRVDERRLNAARGDALLSACGIEAGTVLWCSPDPLDDDDPVLPGKDQKTQSQALTSPRRLHISPPGREITPIHGGPSPNELLRTVSDAYLPRSPRSNLPRLQFTDGQGEVVGVLSYMDCEANQYSLGAISACTGMSSARLAR